MLLPHFTQNSNGIEFLNPDFVHEWINPNTGTKLKSGQGQKEPNEHRQILTLINSVKTN